MLLQPRWFSLPFVTTVEEAGRCALSQESQSGAAANANTCTTRKDSYPPVCTTTYPSLLYTLSDSLSLLPLPGDLCSAFAAAASISMLAATSAAASAWPLGTQLPPPAAVPDPANEPLEGGPHLADSGPNLTSVYLHLCKPIRLLLLPDWRVGR